MKVRHWWLGIIGRFVWNLRLLWIWHTACLWSAECDPIWWQIETEINGKAYNSIHSVQWRYPSVRLTYWDPYNTTGQVFVCRWILNTFYWKKCMLFWFKCHRSFFNFKFSDIVFIASDKKTWQATNKHDLKTINSFWKTKTKNQRVRINETCQTHDHIVETYYNLLDSYTIKSSLVFHTK